MWLLFEVINILYQSQNCGIVTAQAAAVCQPLRKRLSLIGCIQYISRMWKVFGSGVGTACQELQSLIRARIMLEEQQRYVLIQESHHCCTQCVQGS